MARSTRRIQIPNTDKMLEVKLESNQITSIMMLSSSKYLDDFLRTDFLLNPKFVKAHLIVSSILTILISWFNNLSLNSSLWLFLLFMSVVLIALLNEQYVGYKMFLEKLENTPDKNYTVLFEGLEPPMTNQIFNVIYEVVVPDYSKAVKAPSELANKSASEIAEYYAESYKGYSS